ncbi:MAG: phage holin family protein [Candidatus Saccharimonadaceae bacterium]
MKQQILVFLVRWALSAVGLWLAVLILGSGYQNVDVTAGLWGFVLAGLIFSTINSLFKPLLVIVSLPAILLTLGLFTIIVNGVLVYFSLLVAPGISMSFGNSIVTGIILSLLNYVVSVAIELRDVKK